MKLVFLHGAPATGKLTVARALAKQKGARVLDNHAAIDFARTVFDFGAPGFWELIHKVRLAALEAAAENDVALVVMTFCYSEPTDLPWFEDFERVTSAAHAMMAPVYLHCHDDEIARRIDAPERAQRGKTASLDALRAFRVHYHDAPVPRANVLKIDSAAQSAEATAQMIVRHFGL